MCIYVLQLPGRLADAVLSIVPANCGGCPVALCDVFSVACALVCGVLKDLCQLFCEAWSNGGTLGRAVMLSVLMNGVVIWAAMGSIFAKEVEGCPDPLSRVLKTDLVMSILHVLFVFYLKVRVDDAVSQALQAELQLPNAPDREFMSLEHLHHVIMHDCVVSLYVLVEGCSLYYNLFVGVGLVAACENYADGEHLTKAHTCVDWEIWYALLTALFGCHVDCKLRCHSFGREARAQEGTASNLYLPLDAGEPPQSAAAPRV